MLEQAAKSLESFLKANTKQIIEDTHRLNTLRAEWLELHPEYQQYDLQLDVEWQGLSGDSNFPWGSGCLCCCPMPTPPKAKSFRVVTRDWQDERHLNHKIGEHLVRPSRNLIAGINEDLTWDQ